MNYYSQIKWVDEYISNLKPYIYVREDDNLLIKIPNTAYKLNNSGFKIINALINGESVIDILEKFSDKEKKAEDIHHFFCDIRSIFKGCYNEKDERSSVEKIPFTFDFNQLPVLSEIAVTYRCNLSCKFCYAGCGCKKQNNSKELKTGEFKKIISMIKNEAKVPSVSFTGGEPLLRDDIFDLISYAKELGMWTNLITNGTLINEEKAINLKKAGLDSAQVSIEGPGPEIHDHIVNSNGAFSDSIKGIKELMKKGIRVHTNTTISKLNVNHTEGIILLVKSLGLDKFSMNMLMPEGSAIGNIDELLVTYTEVGNKIPEIQRTAEKYNILFMWYSPTPICIFNPITSGLGNKGCAACDGLLSITPDGFILPCSSYPKKMANMMKIKDDFKKVWTSPAFKFFKEKRFAHELCKNCRYFEICNGACPLYWDKLGYEELLINSGGGNN
jgi:radical SAM protein with 4Fe4S-binding SPASM domain